MVKNVNSNKEWYLVDITMRAPAQSSTKNLSTGQISIQGHCSDIFIVKFEQTLSDRVQSSENASVFKKCNKNMKHFIKRHKEFH